MVLEIFPFKYKPFPTDEFPNFKLAKNGSYKLSADKRTLKTYIRKAKFHRFYYLCYDEKYGRSDDYRRKFIKANPPDEDGKYRCVYCGRRIKTNKMCVDHVIPVKAAKRDKRAQRHLRKGVNDLSNLVPSCYRCNEKKWDSTKKIWQIKAQLGKHNVYWAVRYCAILLFACAIIAYIDSKIGNQEIYLDDIVMMIHTLIHNFINTNKRVWFDLSDVMYRIFTWH